MAAGIVKVLFSGSYAWVFPVAPPLDARVTGPVAVSHVKVAILAGQRTILRTAVFIPTALLADGNPEARRLAASNFLVKASLMKMAEKQNNESFGIDLNNCRPPTILTLYNCS